MSNEIAPVVVEQPNTQPVETQPIENKLILIKGSRGIHLETVLEIIP